MLIKPVCIKCKKNIATVKLTRIIEGKVKEYNLCRKCAAEVSPYQKKMAKAQADLNEILSKLLSGAEAKKVEKPKVEITCHDCGVPFQSYRNSLFLGCSNCYEIFEKHLDPDLRRMHGSIRHVGKVPVKYRRQMKAKQTIEDLREQLQRAVEQEEFEFAAKLRDQIKELELKAQK